VIIFITISALSSTISELWVFKCSACAQQTMTCLCQVFQTGTASLLRECSSADTNPDVCLSIYGSTVLLLDLSRFFSFLILYAVGRTPWTGDQPVARPLPTHRTTQTQ
jgi:hypothetical protein